MQTCDVAVIGAGIVGAACAYECAASGLRVTVVEPNAVVSGGTSLGYGNLAVLDEVPGQLALTQYGLALWHKLVDFLPADCEYRQSGSIWLAVEEAEMQEANRRRELFLSRGIDAELLDAVQLADAEPGLRAEVAGGLFLSEDGCLRAGRAAEFLLQLAERNHAQTLRQSAASIQEHEVKLGDGSVLYAGHIVNAMGRHAPVLNPSLSLQLLKGHVLVVETEAHCTQHQLSALALEQEPVAEATVRLELRQSRTVVNNRSEVWIGSSFQEVLPARAGDLVSSQVEPRMVAVLLRRAIEMVPAIGRAKPLQSWTGLRTATADGLPLIGRVTGTDGIFVAVGHGGYGGTAALATAKLIADEILCRTPEIDPHPYRTDRFEGKGAKHA